MKLIQKLLDKHGIERVVQTVVDARRNPPRPIRVVGLDINTNSTGFVVLNERGGVETSGHICTKHLQSDGQILDIGVAIASQITELRNETKGLFQLAQLNGLVSYCALTTFGVAPAHVHPTAARHFFSLKVPAGVAKKKDEIKRVALAHAIATEPALHLPHMPVSAQYDVADAYVVASYSYWRRVIENSIAATPTELRVALWRDMENQLTKQIASNTAKMKKFSKPEYLEAVFRQEIDVWVKTHRLIL
ncbi:hypothetical protein, variant [Aphanomyces invadans]|uniref:Uncharacterized protein n=1 Tax=Aphanomyces invadans TaxID=157072 RepID=A0A024TWP0_9STRA|nr:hypothetical protein, variant [Aphanomyces invadans]ETV98585.1 hypothetical protein, variant [Aphanomyces invadans]|eukprot:XP_008872782.1 hypothetical protein, variant [Aphanomyces invadans]